ncbi:hypothetical protein BC941DRAFT_468623 [Chlamydoabsidia padenii]|nr:hypothetical protein BC941DRAFT_468623 [Chlamydoabsidia padenii]
MEYNEVQRLIHPDDSSKKLTTPRSTTHLTNAGDQSSLDYSSDESSSLDSHTSSLLQHMIPRRYYPLPTASPLPQKKPSWQIISKPSMSKRGSSTSLSKKFVQGVHLLKHKVASLSSSGISNDSIYSDDASDQQHISEIYHHQEHIPIVHQLAPPQSSPIPKSTKKPSRRSSPRWKSYQPYSRTLMTRSRSTSAAIYGFFSNTRLANKRVRKRLDSIWKRRLFRSTPRPTRKLMVMSPNTPILSQNNLARSGYNTSLVKHQSISLRNRPASSLFTHLSVNIQQLQCLIDIEIQSMEDRQRDIGFFTTRLDQLNHDVQYMNKKVAGVSTNVETNLDPLQEEIQHTLPLLALVLHKHHQIVNGFTQNVLRNKAKHSFIKLRSEIKSAKQHIREWDAITHWTFPISMTLLVCILALYIIQFISPVFTLVSIFVLLPFIFA